MIAGSERGIPCLTATAGGGGVSRGNEASLIQVLVHVKGFPGYVFVAWVAGCRNPSWTSAVG